MMPHHLLFFMSIACPLFSLCLVFGGYFCCGHLVLVCSGVQRVGTVVFSDMVSLHLNDTERGWSFVPLICL